MSNIHTPARPRGWPRLRAWLLRLDRRLPLPVKTGIAVGFIAAASTGAMAFLAIDALERLRPFSGGVRGLPPAIDAARQDLVVAFVVGAVGALTAIGLVLYAFVFRRTSRLSRAAAGVAVEHVRRARAAGRGDVLDAVAREMDDLVEALRTRSRQQEAVAELGRVALSGADVPVLLEAAARLLARGMGAESGTVFETTADGFSVRAGTGWASGIVGCRVPADTQPGYTLRSGEPVLVEDLRSETRFRRMWFEEAHGVRSAVSVAIPGAGEPLGVLSAHGGRPRSFSPGDVQFLRSIANTLGAAIRHRTAQHQLRAAEDRHRSLVERIPAVVYTAGFGRAGAWQYVSPRIEALLGYTPDEWIADPELWWKRLHPDDRDRVVAEEEAERAAPPDTPVASEYRMLARDGRVVWVRDEAVVVRDDDGHPLYYQGLLDDITERKASEAALRSAYDREREAADRLRSLDDMKNAFLTAVSHELRTPLSSVLGYAVTLERDGDALPAEDRAHMLHRLAANARKLDRLLSDLLDVDRLSRGIMAPRRAPVDVGALVHKVVADLDLGERPVELDLEGAVLPLDGPKVERIVENLVANVARHTDRGSPVTVRVRAQPDGVLLAVEDRGPGIPDELKQVVFEPFEKGPGTSQHAPGTGIGLSLVARFAELHGGRAWVEDRPGGGASFRVFLARNGDAPNA